MTTPLALLALFALASNDDAASTVAPAPGGAPVLATSDGVGPERFVIVIGYNGGAPDTRPPLSFADDDAARLFLQLAPGASRAWLLTTFDAESARQNGELVDIARPPTRESLAQVLGEISWLHRAAKRAGHQTELVLSFAGHGDVDDLGEGYLVLADGAFSRGDLEAQVVSASPADVNHVIIDACSSYFMVQPRGGGDAADNRESGTARVTPALLDVLGATSSTSAEARARTGVFVSTSGAAEVHESSELQGGIFSFLLRSALAGAGDANGDGRVEYAEAAAFVAAASRGLADPRARLDVHAAAPLRRPHAPMVDLARSGAEHFLLVDRPAHLRILDARGVPYAELNTAGPTPVHIALVGHAFFVVQRGTEEAVLVPRAAGAYALGSLDFEASPRKRGPSATSALFTSPFGTEFVAGFLSSTTTLAEPKPGAPFEVAFAPTGSPAVRFPLATVGFATLGVSAVLFIGAGVAVGGNQVAFTSLQERAEATGQLDTALALQVEGWRTAATAFSVAALASATVGAGLLIYAAQFEEGEVELR